MIIIQNIFAKLKQRKIVFIKIKIIIINIKYKKKFQNLLFLQKFFRLIVII